MKNHHRNAFTLIELLVVIAIIALLASLIVPVVSKAIQNSKKAACVSNLRQIGIGTVSYRVENKDQLPGRRGGATDTFWLWDGVPTFLGLLFDEDLVSDLGVFNCPGQDNQNAYFKEFGTNQLKGKEWGEVGRVVGTYVQREESVSTGDMTQWSIRAFAACCRHGNTLVPHKSKGSNVLYLDGSVRWLSGHEENNYRPSEQSTQDFWEAADEN